MDNKLWWAGFSFAIALSTSGCGEVESCREGTEGCFAGPCIDDTGCKFDLVCVETTSGDSICGERRGDGFECGREDCDEDLGSRCDCEDGELCLPGRPNTCIATYCEDSPLIPGELQPFAPGSCRGKLNDDFEVVPLNFEEACRVRCRQNCALTTAFCTGANCDYGACDDAATQAQCQTECSVADLGEEVALECITQKCNTVMGQACAEFDCPGSVEPNCEQITCSNSCRFPDDGQCDDGDVFSASFLDCNWGSDCNDCGPRTGQRPDTGFGGLCVVDASCDAYEGDPTNPVWCVQIEGQPTGMKRCVPDCSDEGERCPDGYVCDAVQADDTEVFDTDDRRACYPTICQ